MAVIIQSIQQDFVADDGSMAGLIAKHGGSNCDAQSTASLRPSQSICLLRVGLGA